MNWDNRIDEIKTLAQTKTRKEAALALGTSVDNFRKICERYGIDIRERKTYRTEDKKESDAIKREKKLIPMRNEWLMRKWG